MAPFSLRNVQGHDLEKITDHQDYLFDVIKLNTGQEDFQLKVQVHVILCHQIGFHVMKQN